MTELHQAWRDAGRRRARRTTLEALAAVVLLGGGVTWAVQDWVPHADVVDTPVPPSIADSPLPDIVVAWPEERSGTATAIQGTLNDLLRPAISPDGDQVAMATDAGILVVEAGGAQRIVPWPPELAGPFDTRPAVLWRPDDAGFVVMHWQRPWLVDLDGNGEPAPFGDRNNSQVMVDPDTGVVRESRWQNAMIMSWDGDVVAYAPIRDANAVYSDNGHLTARGFPSGGPGMRSIAVAPDLVD